MPRVSGSKDYVSLAQGLITEASPLSFPENATADELNFLLDKEGFVRSRRRGFEKIRSESGVNTSGASIDNVHYWQGPNLLVFIIAVGNTTEARIHRNDDTLSFISSVQIANTAATTEIAENTNVMYITTSNSSKPILLEYEETLSQLRVYEVDILVRDFELVDDGLSLSERPVTLSDSHRYNLYNAGWYKDRRYQYIADQTVQDPVISFFSSLNDVSEANQYPSNADNVAIGISINENGITTFRDDEVRNVNVGNTESPRGHYIYNINDFDRDDRLLNKTEDGSVSTTLTLLQTESI